MQEGPSGEGRRKRTSDISRLEKAQRFSLSLPPFLFVAPLLKVGENVCPFGV